LIRRRLADGAGQGERIACSSDGVFIRVPLEVEAQLAGGSPGAGDGSSKGGQERPYEQEGAVSAMDVAEFVRKARFELLFVERPKCPIRDDDAAPAKTGHGDHQAVVTHDGAAKRTFPERPGKAPTQCKPSTSDAEDSPEQGGRQREPGKHRREVCKRMAGEAEVSSHEGEDLVQAPSRHGPEKPRLGHVDEEEDRRADAHECA
jgi:hypothetical protein